MTRPQHPSYWGVQFPEGGEGFSLPLSQSAPYFSVLWCDQGLWQPDGLSHSLAAFFFHLCHGCFFSLFRSKISPCFSSEQRCRAVVGTGGKGQLGYQCPRSSSWSALHPFSHHSQSRQDPSDPGLLLQELSACWSPPELAQQVLLVSGQAGASQHEKPPNNPSWSAVHPFSLTWDVFTGTICFPSPRVFRPVDYSNGRKCFVSCVISCRFNFYQICQFCHIIGLGFFWSNVCDMFHNANKNSFQTRLWKTSTKKKAKIKISATGELWSDKVGFQMTRYGLWSTVLQFLFAVAATCEGLARGGNAAQDGGVQFQQRMHAPEWFKLLFLCLIFSLLFLYFW